ncbi:hypothetical protein 2200_scaffold1335_00021 [Bacteriophage sp.]|nr:hypothetical protein 2200_scaffold1335_00021 [Bacteriophage sp.]
MQGSLTLYSSQCCHRCHCHPLQCGCGWKDCFRKSS